MHGFGLEFTALTTHSSYEGIVP